METKTGLHLIAVNKQIFSFFAGQRLRPQQVKSAITGTPADATTVKTVPVSTFVPFAPKMVEPAPIIPSLTIQKLTSKFQMISTPKIPTTIRTLLRPEIFAKYLSSHPDHNYANDVMAILVHGAYLGYNGPRTSRITPNSPSALIHKQLLVDSVSKEVSALHTCGPFNYPPLPNFVSSLLFVIPKKNSNKFRAILNLSSPEGESINDFIDPQCYSMHYSRVDEAVTFLCSLGPAAQLQ